MKPSKDRPLNSVARAMPSGSGDEATIPAPGLQTILTGCALALFGVMTYVLTIAHAGHDAAILHALGSQGLPGAASAVLLLSGVSTWVVGNIIALRKLLGRQ